MTRIVGGRWRGRTLSTPAGSTTRPTGEKTRAALGNALAATGELEGAAVLDLYAGTGALGLELLSRGAASLVAVEADHAALRALRANIAALDAAGTARAVAGDVGPALARLAGAGERFDVVLADPPYDLAAEALHSVLAALPPLLSAGADIVVERSARSGEIAWPEPLAAVRVKRYGDTLLCYGRLP